MCTFHDTIEHVFECHLGVLLMIEKLVDLVEHTREIVEELRLVSIGERAFVLATIEFAYENVQS